MRRYGEIGSSQGARGWLRGMTSDGNTVRRYIEAEAVDRAQRIGTRSEDPMTRSAPKQD